jgi:hypothetical protein
MHGTWIFRVCRSEKELFSGRTTHGSKGQLCPEDPPAPVERVQVRGSVMPFIPGVEVNVVSRRQLRHITVTVCAMCLGLLAAVTMPGNITSCATLADCMH